MGNYEMNACGISWFSEPCLTHGERSVSGAQTTTSRGPIAVWAIARHASLQHRQPARAMEKTRTTSAWKTPSAFPTFPQLRRLLGQVEVVLSRVRKLGAGHGSQRVAIDFGHDALPAIAIVDRINLVGHRVDRYG